LEVTIGGGAPAAGRRLGDTAGPPGWIPVSAQIARALCDAAATLSEAMNSNTLNVLAGPLIPPSSSAAAAARAPGCGVVRRPHARRRRRRPGRPGRHPPHWPPDHLLLRRRRHHCRDHRHPDSLTSGTATEYRPAEL
jgi:hypothetical protein